MLTYAVDTQKTLIAGFESWDTSRLVIVWVALILVGGFLLVTAPPDPYYSVSVYGPTDAPEGEPVVEFENLSAENRSLFRESFDDAKRFAEPPTVRERYVDYDGETYRMSSSVHEGSVFSLFMPPIGGFFLVIGGIVAVYRHLYRS